MQRKRSDIEKSLLKKGFQTEETHHKYYKFYDGVQYTGVYTFISRGSKYREYGDGLLSMMVKQLKLDNKRELCELIDCPMGEEEYRQKLKEKGLL